MHSPHASIVPTATAITSIPSAPTAPSDYKWTTFWESFSSIHKNSALSSNDKFNYLTSLLESTAAEAIAGLTPTDANYEELP